MNAMSRWRFLNAMLAPVAFVASVAATTPAFAETRYYRFGLDTESPGYRFSHEMVKTKDTQGGYVGVDFDAQHRPLRITSYFDNRELGSVRYLYSGRSLSPDSAESFDKNAAPTGRTKMTHDQSGRVIRKDYYTPSGRFTGYTVYTYNANVVEVVRYATSGKVKGKCVETYTNDILSHSSCTPDAHRRTESDYDTDTGLVSAQTTFDDGKFVIRNTDTYDANGDTVRRDRYDQNGRWYGMDTYSENRLTQRLYKFPDGISKEILLSYDAREWLKEARLTINGNPICTFSYVREDNGTVTKTVARSPYGTIIAEYPDQAVFDVKRDGRPPLHPDEAILFRQGNWW
jgi:hypothetical protein